MAGPSSSSRDLVTVRHTDLIPRHLLWIAIGMAILRMFVLQLPNPKEDASFFLGFFFQYRPLLIIWLTTVASAVLVWLAGTDRYIFLYAVLALYNQAAVACFFFAIEIHVFDIISSMYMIFVFLIDIHCIDILTKFKPYFTNVLWPGDNLLIERKKRSA